MTFWRPCVSHGPAGRTHSRHTSDTYNCPQISHTTTSFTLSVYDESSIKPPTTNLVPSLLQHRWHFTHTGRRLNRQLFMNSHSNSHISKVFELEYSMFRMIRARIPYRSNYSGSFNLSRILYTLSSCEILSPCSFLPLCGFVALLILHSC